MHLRDAQVVSQVGHDLSKLGLGVEAAWAGGVELAVEPASAYGTTGRGWRWWLHLICYVQPKGVQMAVQLSSDTLKGYRTHLLAWGMAAYSVLQSNGLGVPTEWQGHDMTNFLTGHPITAVVLAGIFSALRAGIKNDTGEAAAPTPPKAGGAS